jgi:TolB-like protein/DNA-binding winged helix-turn-helix (wHTH) protein/tetratricopeptide (TPR) repeat protein
MHSPPNNKDPVGDAFGLDRWLVEPALGRIVSEDEVKKLEPRAMEVLVYLARHQGELVSRDELEREVWHGALVGYDAVTGTIIKLRKALQDSARQPRFIETIPKRGYRLIAPVTLPAEHNGATHPDHGTDALQHAGAGPEATARSPGAAAPNTAGGRDDVGAIKAPSLPIARSRTTEILLGSVLVIAVAAAFFADRLFDCGPSDPALSLPERPSLAVLPFENLGDDPADDYFSDGMTDDLITDLSQLPDIFLISRQSSFSYKDKGVDPRTVGHELGVRYLLVGSVRRGGETLRVNAQLVEALRGEQLWAERFDQKVADVFAVHDKINARILEALSLTLTDAETRGLGARGTASPAAYDAYLKGMSHFWRATADDYDLALDNLEQAISIDPDYTNAYAALAAVHWQAFKRGLSRNQPWMGLYWEKIVDALGKALERPSALAYFVDSGVYTTNHRHEQAVAQARMAVEKFPNDALAHLALADALSFDGRPDEAKVAAEQGLRLDPRRPEPYLFALGRAQFEMQRMEDAAATLRRVVRENATDVLPRILLASALGHLGRTHEARQQLDQLETLNRRNRLLRLNLRDLRSVADARPTDNQQRLEATSYS